MLGVEDIDVPTLLPMGFYGARGQVQADNVLFLEYYDYEGDPFNNQSKTIKFYSTPVADIRHSSNEDSVKFEMEKHKTKDITEDFVTKAEWIQNGRQCVIEFYPAMEKSIVNYIIRGVRDYREII